MDPTPLCSSPSVLQIYLVFNWSILNNNIKTYLCWMLVSAKVGAHTRDTETDSQMR